MKKPRKGESTKHRVKPDEQISTGMNPEGMTQNPSYTN
jgi:hypothetical protein